jgi:hypothetical protein
MAEFYEVIEAKIWRADDGASASIYGAVPYRSENEKLQRGWRMISTGWTVRNPLTGQVGTGRPPSKTYAEACEYAAKLGRPSRICIGD